MAGIGDIIKAPTSNRITVGDVLNNMQNGAAIYGGTSGGSTNTYLMNFSNSPATFVAGQKFWFIADKTNTGSVTIQHGTNTATLKDILGLGTLGAGEIQAGDYVEYYVADSSNCRLITARSLSGWELLSLTGTYVSASSFSVPFDCTGYIQQGDKLKFANPGTKFATVASVSFGSGVTTITIHVNIDYTVANSSIIQIYFSKQSNPQGFPAYFNFTPTLTSAAGVLSAGAIGLARATLVNRHLAHISILYTFTLASSTSSSVSFTIPYNGASGNPRVSICTESGGSEANGFCILPSTTNVCGVFRSAQTPWSIGTLRLVSGNFTMLLL